MAKNKNFLLIAVDDLRPMFGRSFGEEEVLTPKLDNFFFGPEWYRFPKFLRPDCRMWSVQGQHIDWTTA